MAVSNSHITILTLNVNGLNAPIKRHRLANWIKSQNASVCCIQETHLTCKATHRLKIEGWRKIYQSNAGLVFSHSPIYFGGSLCSFSFFISALVNLTVMCLELLFLRSILVVLSVFPEFECWAVLLG